MHIITAANERYFGAIQPYLDSLTRNVQVPVTLVCVGDRMFTKPGITAVQLPRAKNAGAPTQTECPQHGTWLQVVDGEPDDVCIFTDGDIIAQRPFTGEELDYLADLGDNHITCGYNSGPDETLAIEGRRLFPKWDDAKLRQVFGPIDDIPCYNIGVIAARRSVFERIYNYYMLWWDTVGEAFGHAARQQWLVCWTIYQLGIRVDVTPYSLHANGHYGVPPGCHYDNGLLYHRGNLVLFRHKL